jgi:hypothetical protein
MAPAAISAQALPREFLQYRAIRALDAVAAFHQVLEAPAHFLQLRKPRIDAPDLRLREASDVRAGAMAIAPQG